MSLRNIKEENLSIGSTELLPESGKLLTSESRKKVAEGLHDELEV